MKRIFPFTLKMDSLFIRLFISFLMIIVLLVSFNFFSFSFFRDNIRDEIIRYNNANLKNTTSGFEKHFLLVNHLVLRLYLSEHIQPLVSNPDINYGLTLQARREIQTVVSSELLFVENVVLYFKDSSFILEKGGSTRAETMFTKFYRSDDYPYRFWKNEFAKEYQFKVYPAATFSEISFHDVVVSRKVLFPVISRSRLYPDVYFTTFLDVNKIIHAYHHSINENFLILDDQGNPLYPLDHAIEPALAQLHAEQGYLKEGNNYYFYEKGTTTGFTYVNRIPIENISSQITRLNVTLVSLLIAAVAISVIASLLFSIRINNPVKHIMHSMQVKSHAGLRSPIKEFNVIAAQLTHIHQDLTNKNSVLRYYAYTNKLKNIHSPFEEFNEFKELFDGDKPFFMLLFHLQFKKAFHEKMDAETDRAAYFIREYISQIIDKSYADANTFQIENDQILTLVFGEDNRALLADVTGYLKKVFDRDHDVCNVTIAASSLYTNAADYTKAYEQVIRRMKQRRLVDETQIVLEDADYTGGVALTRSMEQQLETYLQAGNEEAVIPWVHKAFAPLAKKQAPAADYYDYSEQVYKQVVRVLASCNILHVAFTEEYLTEQLANCYDVHQLQQFLEQVLVTAARLIQGKKEERDHIVSAVNRYIEEHYTEDISLDAVADTLRITSGYLSSYYKEKTGINFMDALNQVRINRAKEALLHSNVRVQDIAEQVGYQNLNSFYRMFKKHAGLPPNKFRQWMGGEGEGEGEGGGRPEGS